MMRWGRLYVRDAYTTQGWRTWKWLLFSLLFSLSQACLFASSFVVS
uniref:Uncharacterized protein n=1 Tax=Arundo donax TaxID=35708 RepID=A0A0A9F7I1_ARUDO